MQRILPPWLASTSCGSNPEVFLLLGEFGASRPENNMRDEPQVLMAPTEFLPFSALLRNDHSLMSPSLPPLLCCQDGKYVIERLDM